MTEPVTRHPSPRHAPGTPCWASLLVHDLAGGQEFYHGLFGWEFSSGPQQMGPYVRALVDGHQVAGLGEIGGGQRLPVAWLPYLASDDADATADLIRERGGTVAVGPLDAEDEGRMAIAADTVGASFGVWQGGQHRGVAEAAAGRSGAPVWFELAVRDTTQPGVFYPPVFGYEATTGAGTGTGGSGGSGPDSGAGAAGFDYLTLRLDGAPVAGVHGVGRDLPPRQGPHWRTYFAVEGVDAAARRAEELGGGVARAPADSPHGRVAALTDPEGAGFRIVEAR